jgi:hypothetical protein
VPGLQSDDFAPHHSAVRRIGVIFALIVLAGCSSTTGPSKYGAQYLRITAPANNALTRFQDQLSSLGKDAPRSDVAKAATPLISTLQAIDRDLGRAPWPPGVDTDIKAEVVADSAIIADLSVAGAQPHWEDQLRADEAKASDKARIVRSDLHLERG